MYLVHLASHICILGVFLLQLQGDLCMIFFHYRGFILLKLNKVFVRRVYSDQQCDTGTISSMRAFIMIDFVRTKRQDFNLHRDNIS